MNFVLKCVFCSLLSGMLLSFFATVAYPQDIPALQAPESLPQEQTPVESSSPDLTPSAPQSKKKIVYREKSYFEFEDTLINGNLRAPDGSFVFRKSQSNFSSALNLRRSFIPELKSSSNDAR